MYSGFKYESLEGGIVAPIRFRSASHAEEGGWATCHDYINGGPLFALPGHSPLEPEPWQKIEAAFPDVEVLPHLNASAALTPPHALSPFARQHEVSNTA